MRLKKSVHPLLLEPTYWRDRLRASNTVSQSVLTFPRPDLSGGGRNVVEFRLKAHDGTRLWGLFARPAWQRGPYAARIRAVGPAARPMIDGPTLEEGTAEIVFQESAGRRLEDRVLDTVRVWQMAVQSDGIDPLRVSFASAPGTPEPDEFLIAQQLFEGRFC